MIAEVMIIKTIEVEGAKKNMYKFLQQLKKEFNPHFKIKAWEIKK